MDFTSSTWTGTFWKNLRTIAKDRGGGGTRMSMPYTFFKYPLDFQVTIPHPLHTHLFLDFLMHIGRSKKMVQNSERILLIYFVGTGKHPVSPQRPVEMLGTGSISIHKYVVQRNEEKNLGYKNLIPPESYRHRKTLIDSRLEIGKASEPLARGRTSKKNLSLFWPNNFLGCSLFLSLLVYLRVLVLPVLYLNTCPQPKPELEYTLLVISGIKKLARYFIVTWNMKPKTFNLFIFVYIP